MYAPDIEYLSPKQKQLFLAVNWLLYACININLKNGERIEGRFIDSYDYLTYYDKKAEKRFLIPVKDIKSIKIINLRN